MGATWVCQYETRRVNWQTISPKCQPEAHPPPKPHRQSLCNIPLNSIFPQIRGRNGINYHVDVIKWKYFPRYWPFVRGIHRWPVNSPHNGQWCRASVYSLICAWTNGWVNNQDAGDLRRYRVHYDVSDDESENYIHVHFTVKLHTPGCSLYGVTTPFSTKLEQPTLPAIPNPANAKMLHEEHLNMVLHNSISSKTCT